MKTITITRTEAELLVDLLEGQTPITSLKQEEWIEMAAELRRAFHMSTKEESDAARQKLTAEQAHQQINAKLRQAIRERHLAIEKLTEEQTLTVLKEAIASGDLMRHVRVTDDAQAVSYVPYREVEALRRGVEDAKGIMRQLLIELPAKRAEVEQQMRDFIDDIMTL